MSAEERQSGTGTVVAFVVATIGALAGAVVYFLGGQAQLEGLFLGTSLGGIAVGLILFARQMLPGGHFVQVREEHPTGPDERGDVASAFWSGAAPIERRSLIAKSFVLALGSLGLAALFPIRSLGTRPGRTLAHTEWRAGLRMVTEHGLALRPEDIDVNGVRTVFPEGHTHAADSQTLLIRLPPTVRPPGPDGWTVGGVVAFSKICTHAGCPVGLYLAESQELFCPCHQSTFSVPQGAKPTFGPATRRLPQLPIGLDGNGFLVALDDYPEPVGPGYWTRPRD
ncbi:MAG: Rieske (2Fe-2S) protein [Actinomycetota bacterium]|nr:Rieske (2Fe-2S) protein [Actinomycetota bacterium]